MKKVFALLLVLVLVFTITSTALAAVKATLPLEAYPAFFKSNKFEPLLGGYGARLCYNRDVEFRFE